MTHALSVDVEDWNNVALLHRCGKVVPPQPVVVRDTERMLELFLRHGARATWFILGEVAEAYPQLVKKLADAGQELGVHGYHHHLVYTLSEPQFRENIRRAKDVVEQASGRKVAGYRATAFSITKQNVWAFDILAELGFDYDSSVFPFRGGRYGHPAAPLQPYRLPTKSGELTEIPLSVMDFGKLRVPCCGGGYLRHFPLWYTRWAMAVLTRRGRRAVFYLHPCEIEAAFDRAFFRQHLANVDTLGFRRMKYLQFRNRGQTERKLEWLLRRFAFGSLAEVFNMRQRPDAGADCTPSNAAPTAV